MIPPFLENGYLPPGLHPASLDEIAQRFGHESELRRVQMESVRWMIDLAVRAGAERENCKVDFSAVWHSKRC